jgi:hypothetical protein
MPPVYDAGSYLLNKLTVAKFKPKPTLKTQ